MERDLYMAAMNGNVDFFNEVRHREIENGCCDSYLLSLTPQKNNILHIASHYDQFDFMKSGFNSLNFSPLMIVQRNATGDTPLHVASKRGNKKIVKLLVDAINKLVVREVLVSEDDYDQQRPWKIRNLEGNTPLHEALINGKVEVAKYLLVEVDPQVASVVNNTGETPLHLAIKHNVNGDKKFVMHTIELLNKLQASVPYKGIWLAEKSEDIIKLLLQQHKEAAYTRDGYGLTPLLRAAIHCHLSAIEIILNECPECAEICSPKGETILHLIKFRSYDEVKKLMEIPQIVNLKDQQDDMGNTPAYIAVMNCKASITEEHKAFTINDIGVIKALLESSANFAIKNKQGVSAAALFQQLEAHFSGNVKLHEFDMDIDESLAKIKQKQNEFPIWDDVQNADMNSLRTRMDMLSSCLLNGTLRLPDLLYILLRNLDRICYNEVETLIRDILEKSPVLISQTTSRGDNLLHIIARMHRDFEIDHDVPQPLLYLIKQCYERVEHEVYFSPWRMKNREGNTPLHEALLCAAPKARAIISFLINCDASVAAYVNNQTETPLHVLCGSQYKVDDECMIKEIIDANPLAPYSRDAHGFTPLLRAAKRGQVDVVKHICQMSSDSAQLRDGEGKTFWHLMDMSGVSTETEKEIGRELYKIESIKKLSSALDNDRNTPLHLAIVNKNYNLAQVLSENNKNKVYEELRQLEKEGVDQYSFHMLRYAHHLSEQHEQLLWGKMKDLGVKSIYGVPTSQIKDYTSTISVIAVLLATIAFTGAFTVPGGYDSNIGYPILLNQTNHDFVIRGSYMVFMVADILTMCLSMMVLFCLQWIITGDDKDRVVLTDLTIVLLQGSFMTTMVALMMGVFTTTYQDSPELAIFTIVACSAVLLLLQKSLVMGPYQYLFLTAYLFVQIVWDASRRLLFGEDNEEKARHLRQ